MGAYIPNRRCYCGRCRYRGMMGPVVLITLGVLFLLGEFTHWDFGRTWPILLIAIGVVKVLGSSADDSAHVAPDLPEQLRQGFNPASYPPPPPVNPPAQDQQPPQEVNHV
ncbi:MAG: LiaI-LiaF-like domain-containing protein [Terriglobales bacterium]